MIQRTGLEASAVKVQLRPALAQVLGAIKVDGGRVTARELVDLMEIGNSTAYTYLNELLNLNLLERVKISSRNGTGKEYLYSVTVSSDQERLEDFSENRAPEIAQPEILGEKFILPRSEVIPQAEPDQFEVLLELIFRLTSRVKSLEGQLAIVAQQEERQYPLLSKIQKMME